MSVFFCGSPSSPFIFLYHHVTNNGKSVANKSSRSGVCVCVSNNGEIQRQTHVFPIEYIFRRRSYLSIPFFFPFIPSCTWLCIRFFKKRISHLLERLTDVMFVCPSDLEVFSGSQWSFPSQKLMRAGTLAFGGEKKNVMSPHPILLDISELEIKHLWPDRNRDQVMREQTEGKAHLEMLLPKYPEAWKESVFGFLHQDRGINDASGS